MLLGRQLFILFLILPGCSRVGFYNPDSGTETPVDRRVPEGRRDAPPLDIMVKETLPDRWGDDLQPDGVAPLDAPAGKDQQPPDQQLPDSAVVPGTWVTVGKGTFTMGSPASDPCRLSDEDQHQVTLNHSFAMQTTEVTQGQFQTMMGYNPSTTASCGTTCPVETVSWYEAAAYCNALSSKMGLQSCYTCTGSGTGVSCTESTSWSGPSFFGCPGYRLPTEAEWELAYRAGTTTAYYSGANDPALCTSCFATDANLDKIGWYCANSGSKTHPVMMKQANAWGLYDMAGNVWEWCNDWYQASLGTSPVTEPWGAASGSNRTLRGGSYNNTVSGYAKNARAAFRNHTHPPSYSSARGGFRCIRSMP